MVHVRSVTTVAASGGAGAAAGVVLLLVVIALGIGVYFIPTIVAFSRKHHQAGAVFAINFLLGWSIIGWAVALAMALSAHRQPQVVLNQYGPAAPPQSPTQGPAPGWYVDTARPWVERWWDGYQWTQVEREVGPPPPQPPLPPVA